MIKINMDKAKEIAHEKRRAARAEKFAPYDEVIAKQIPGVSAEEAEAARQVIREEDALLQTSMDNATSAEELKTLLPE